MAVILRPYQTLYSQCDQMVNIFVHNMAIHDDKHSPKSIQICPSTFKIVPKTQQTLKVLPNHLIFLPKWRNLAKSGHTVYNNHCLSDFNFFVLMWFNFFTSTLVCVSTYAFLPMLVYWTRLCLFLTQLTTYCFTSLHLYAFICFKKVI